MPTNDVLMAMAHALEINPRGVTVNEREALSLAIKERSEAAAMLRAILAEREREFICGRCGKRFDGPKQEIDW